MNKRKVLVCEDTLDLRILVKRVLENKSYDVTTCENGEACLDIYDSSYSLVILDINLPGIDGLSVLEKMQKENPSVAVIMMTAYSSIEQSVKAVKMGAKNYIAKPFSMKAFLAAVQECEEELFSPDIGEFPDYLNESNSPSMCEFLRKVNRIADSDINVALTGESGTGKEYIAKYIHNLSARKDGNYITIDCPAIPHSLFETELFGHVSGAFTGAKENRTGKLKRAHKGTLFFDEVADLSLEGQAKLLRSIQEREFEAIGSNKKEKVDIRIISATSKRLLSEASSGRFRKDLYYRLAEIELEVPSLRDRKEDIPLFVDYFCRLFAKKHGSSQLVFSSTAMGQLCNYNWPGNIRELKSLVYRTLLIADSKEGVISLVPSEYLMKEDIPTSSSTDENRGSCCNEASGVVSMQEHEYKAIVDALQKTGNNITNAAKLLNIGRTTLYRKMKKMKKTS